MANPSNPNPLQGRTDQPSLLNPQIEVKNLELSIVVPVYNEESNILPFYERVTAVLEKLQGQWEIIFVIDGSVDSSLEVASSIAAKDSRVVVIELARNFGQQVAISAGLEYAVGRGVAVMDADLQDPPEILFDLINKWKEGYEVVYGVRVRRKENIFKRTAYLLFYRILHRISNIPIPLDAGDFCVMDRRVVNILNSMPERNRFVRGIRSWIGFRQVGLIYERPSRYSGKPGYTLFRLLILALDGLVSFSYFPLRLISILGLGVSFFSIILSIFYIIKKIFFGLNPPGFATLVVAIFFLSGIQLITIGVIGEYIGRISEEVKRRPLYLVRQIINKTKKDY